MAGGSIIAEAFVAVRPSYDKFAENLREQIPKKIASVTQAQRSVKIIPVLDKDAITALQTKLTNTKFTVTVTALPDTAALETLRAEISKPIKVPVEFVQTGAVPTPGKVAPVTTGAVAPIVGAAANASVAELSALLTQIEKLQRAGGGGTGGGGGGAGGASRLSEGDRLARMQENIAKVTREVSKATGDEAVATDRLRQAKDALRRATADFDVLQKSDEATTRKTSAALRAEAAAAVEVAAVRQRLLQITKQPLAISGDTNLTKQQTAAQARLTEVTNLASRANLTNDESLKKLAATRVTEAQKSSDRAAALLKKETEAATKAAGGPARVSAKALTDTERFAELQKRVADTTALVRKRVTEEGLAIERTAAAEAALAAVDKERLAAAEGSSARRRLTALRDQAQSAVGFAKLREQIVAQPSRETIARPDERLAFGDLKGAINQTTVAVENLLRARELEVAAGKTDSDALQQTAAARRRAAQAFFDESVAIEKVAIEQAKLAAEEVASSQRIGALREKIATTPITSPKDLQGFTNLKAVQQQSVAAAEQLLGAREREQQARAIGNNELIEEAVNRRKAAQATFGEAAAIEKLAAEQARVSALAPGQRLQAFAAQGISPTQTGLTGREAELQAKAAAEQVTRAKELEKLNVAGSASERALAESLVEEANTAKLAADTELKHALALDRTLASVVALRKELATAGIISRGTGRPGEQVPALNILGIEDPAELQQRLDAGKRAQKESERLASSLTKSGQVEAAATVSGLKEQAAAFVQAGEAQKAFFAARAEINAQSKVGVAGLEDERVATRQLKDAKQAAAIAEDAYTAALKTQDEELIRNAALVREQGRAAVTAREDELAAAKKSAGAAPLLRVHERLQGQAVLASQAGQAFTGVPAARAEFVAARDVDRQAQALLRAAEASKSLRKEQLELIQGFAANTAAAKENAAALLRTAEAAAVSGKIYEQARRGIIATSASFLGLRGAVLSSSAGFLIATIALTTFSKIIAQGGELEQGLNTFQAVTGATAEQMKAVGAEAQALGADIRLPATSANDAVAAMTELAKAGLSVDQAMAAARGSLELAAAANIKAADAAQITAGVLNQFRLSGEKAAEVSDLLAGASILAQGSINDFAQGFRALGPTAELAGVSIHQTTALLTELGRAGLTGAFGGTAIKTFLLNLVPATKASSDAQKELNVHLDQTRSIGEQLPSIIAQYTAGLAKLQPLERTRVLQTIFGTRGIQAAGVIFGQGTANFLELQAQVSKTGYGATLADARMKGLRGSVDALGSSTQTLATELARFFVPTLTTITREMTKMVNAAGEVVQVFTPLAQVFQAFSATPLAGIIAQVGLLVAGALAVGKAVERWKRFFGTAEGELVAGTAASTAALDKTAIAADEVAQGMAAAGEQAAVLGDSVAKGAVVGAEAVVEYERVKQEAIAATDEQIKGQAVLFGSVAVANKGGAATVADYEALKQAAIEKTNVQIKGQMVLFEEADLLAKRSLGGQLAGAGGIFGKADKNLKGKGGALGRLSTGALTAGIAGTFAAQAIGDKAGPLGPTLDAASQGAIFGSIFGVEGAAIGAAAFGGLSLIEDSHRRAEKRRQKFKDDFKKLSFDDQLQYLEDHFPHLTKQIEKLRTTSLFDVKGSSGALANLLNTSASSTVGADIAGTLGQQVDKLGGFNFGITQKDITAANQTILAGAKGAALPTSPGSPKGGLDVGKTGTFGLLINPLATSEAQKDAEGAAAAAGGTVVNLNKGLQKGTTAFKDFKTYMAAFGVSLDAAKNEQNKVKVEANLTQDTQRALDEALAGLASGTDSSTASFRKQEQADKRLITSLRAKLTAPNAALNGWLYSAKQRKEIAERIIKIAGDLTGLNDKIIASIQKAFEVPTAQATLAQTAAEGTTSLQDNLASDQSALKVQQDILKKYQDTGRKQTDILAQQNVVQAAKNKITADTTAINDKAAQDAADAISAQEAGLRLAADQAGNLGKSEDKLLKFLQGRVNAAKPKTKEYYDAVAALNAERDKRDQVLQNLKKSAQDLIDKRQQNRLSAAGLTDTKVDDKAALNAILGTENRRLILAQKAAEALRKQGKIGTQKWYEAQGTIEDLKGQIIATKSQLKGLTGETDSGFSLGDLFKGAVDQFNEFGGNIASRNGMFSGTDVRATFAASILNQRTDPVASAVRSGAEKQVNESRKQTDYLRLIYQNTVPGGFDLVKEKKKTAPRNISPWRYPSELVAAMTRSGA